MLMKNNMSELRKNILDEARRIVVKIGSRILVDSDKGGVPTPLPASWKRGRKS